MSSLDKLEEELRSYMANNPNVPPEMHIEKCSWSTVMEQLKLAQKARHDYQAAARPLKGVIPYIWRTMGRASKIVGPGLDVIPDEPGLSILKGGLAIIFSVRT